MDKIDALISGTLAVLGFVLFVWGVFIIIEVIITLCNIKEEKRKTKMRFATFVNYYNLNPDKYNIDDLFYVEYILTSKSIDQSYITIVFPLKDVPRYWLWKIKKNKESKQSQQSEVMGKYLKEVMVDLEKFKEKHCKEEIK